MSNYSYHIDIPAFALLILLAVMLHISSQAQLEDRSSKLYRKLLLLSILDIFFDMVSILVPLIPGLHVPVLFNLLNGVYFQLNVYMLYTLFFYFNNLRDDSTELPTVVRVASAIPGILSAVLLVGNLFFHFVFWYDQESIYHQGPLYYFIYILAFLYLIATLVLILVYHRQFSRWKHSFMRQTLVTLLICILIQLYKPEMLTIDLGISLSVLLFYLHYNNPVRYVDFLTGAFDKSYFDIWMQEQLTLGNPVDLVAIRASNLKEIGLLHGDQKVDSYLASLAKALRQFDQDGKVFRISSNWFLIHSRDPEGFHQKLEDITAWCSGRKSKKLLPGCSLYVVGVPGADQLINDYPIQAYAEYLYNHLRTEGSVQIISNEEYLSGFRYDQEIQRYVREAVSQNLFTLAFQPIYHLKKQSFTSVEVLTRLSHPAFGILEPQKIIQIAEQEDLINEITQLQFVRLCTFLRDHPEVTQQIDRFKFNLSPYMMSSQNVAALIQIIDDYGLESSKLGFEITESLATTLNPEMMLIVQMMQERDIELSLDDFGSGYSNLSNVLQFPFQTIKMDRSLILQVSENDSAATFYKEILRIIQEFHMEIVCEGIESKLEVDLLEKWGADMIQGFYYTKPLSEEKFLTFLVQEQGNE